MRNLVNCVAVRAACYLIPGTRYSITRACRSVLVPRVLTCFSVFITLQSYPFFWTMDVHTPPT